MIEKIILGIYICCESKGIYMIDFDIEKEELFSFLLVVEENSFIYLVKSKVGNFYMVISVDGLGGAGVYDKDFYFLNVVIEFGVFLCYVVVDEIW